MKKFDFRLEKVLEYRRMAEEWAKEVYLEAKAQRLESEVILLGLKQQRDDLLVHPPMSIEECQALDLHLQLLEDQARRQRTVIDVLRVDEERALADYTEKRAEAEVIDKLRDKAFDEWMLAMNRKEQADLDEWAVQRRAA